jgi:phosphinothricin acetyltransferase
MIGMEIRTLTADDWDTVRSIYLDGLATGQATFETQAPSWTQWNNAHLPVPRLVATSEECVLGWAALSPVSARAVYVGVAEVSVYVDKDSRGKGVGKALFAALIAESEKNGIWTLQASVFPENVASIALHRACDFCVVGRRERIGKRNGVWRDTLLLERRSKRVGIE